MAFAFPSLLTRNVLQSGAKSSQGRLGQLVFPHSGLSFSVPLKATNQLRFQHTFQSIPSTVVRTARSTGSKEKRGISLLIKGATVAGVGLGLANQRNSIIHCDGKSVKCNNTTNAANLKKVEDATFIRTRPQAVKNSSICLSGGPRATPYIICIAI
jgi:hypothetical protein